MACITASHKFRMYIRGRWKRWVWMGYSINKVEIQFYSDKTSRYETVKNNCVIDDRRNLLLWTRTSIFAIFLIASEHQSCFDSTYKFGLANDLEHTRPMDRARKSLRNGNYILRSKDISE